MVYERYCASIKWLALGVYHPRFLGENTTIIKGKFSHFFGLSNKIKPQIFNFKVNSLMFLNIYDCKVPGEQRTFVCYGPGRNTGRRNKWSEKSVNEIASHSSSDQTQE